MSEFYKRSRGASSVSQNGERANCPTFGIIFGPEKPSRTILQIRLLSIRIHSGGGIPLNGVSQNLAVNSGCLFMDVGVCRLSQNSS